MSGATARLFAALDLPAAPGDRLAVWGRHAAAADPALRAVGSGSLHITLHFLGERPVAHLEALGAAVLAAAAEVEAALRLRTAGALWLAPRRPSVLTCAIVEGGDGMAALQARLAPALAAASDGWSAEARPLQAHVTVARVRRGAHPRVGAVPAAPELAWTAPSLSLQRSWPQAGGARHEILVRGVLPSA